jgi:hypothetical protein
MADNAKAATGSGQPEFSEADKSRARQWFKKGADCRDRREYDYAIECYVTGLSFWPEAVEEGHMPLHSLAVQRQQAGGKKPAMMESMKRPTGGKDAKQAMLNAAYLLAKDPGNHSYLDALLRNAGRAGYDGTLKWIAPRVMDNLRKDAKPNLARFKVFRAALVEAAEQAAARGDVAAAAWLYEQAVTSVEYLLARNPGDAALRDEQRDLSGKLTIARGKYAEADSFRDSLHDAETQRHLHDVDRVIAADQTQDELIETARRQWEEQPTAPLRINAYVDALLKRERPEEESGAVQVLTQAFEATSNYSFKSRADDVRLKQIKRQVQSLREQARQSGLEDDKQQARLADSELVQTEIEIYRERIQKYPTDLRSKYRLGEALFRAGEYDEAIPVLQVGQADPRSRGRSQLLIGRAFFEKQTFAQASEVLREALEGHEIGTDELAKELIYWLARSCEADGRNDEAKQHYGRLLRLDYNYRGGDARRRMESLK